MHFTGCLKVTSDSPNSRLINTQICGYLLYRQVNKTQCLPDNSSTQILTVNATPYRFTGHHSICVHAPRPIKPAYAHVTLLRKCMHIMRIKIAFLQDYIKPLYHRKVTVVQSQGLPVKGQSSSQPLPGISIWQSVLRKVDTCIHHTCCYIETSTLLKRFV